jgi:hypothetical protein
MEFTTRTESRRNGYRWKAGTDLSKADRPERAYLIKVCSPLARLVLIFLSPALGCIYHYIYYHYGSMY